MKPAGALITDMRARKAWQYMHSHMRSLTVGQPLSSRECACLDADVAIMNLITSTVSADDVPSVVSIVRSLLLCSYLKRDVRGELSWLLLLRPRHRGDPISTVDAYELLRADCSALASRSGPCNVRLFGYASRWVVANALTQSSDEGPYHFVE